MRKILLQIITFSAIFIGIFGVMRIVMQRAFIAQSVVESNFNDIVKMYVYGAVSDMRTISALLLPLFICGFLSYLAPFVSCKTSQRFANLYARCSCIYIALLGFISVIFAFVSFYYFQMFNNKIDLFIFGLKDDNTDTLLNIIWNDYPIMRIIACALVISALCVWLNARIMRINFVAMRIKIPMRILLNIVLICVYIVALRGPFKYIILRETNYAFSDIAAINDISINSLMAMHWAYKNYMRSGELHVISNNEAEQLQDEFFTLYYTSPDNPKALDVQPHVVLNIMESFGCNMLEFNDELDLLGELAPHFESDFVFKRFLSANNNTLTSFSSLVFNTPNTVSNGIYKKMPLSQSVIDVYKRAGYKIIFVSSGNAVWMELGPYMKRLGIDEIIDENTLIREYPEAKATQNGYGIADEFAYKKIYELLEKSESSLDSNNSQKTKLFIFHLSISNHPPYTPPTHYINDSQIPSTLLNNLYSSRESNKKLIVQAYVYANNEFGKFLTRIKDSRLKDRVIIAATGDHRMRELAIDIESQKAFAYSVPFYIYVPQILQNSELYYDSARIGSHKDIFPTLYALSLSNAQYISVGGRNLLGAINDERLEFGINANVLIDKSGIYPIDSTKGYFYQNQNTLKDTNVAFERDDYHKNLIDAYHKLDSYQVASRLGLIDKTSK